MRPLLAAAGFIALTLPALAFSVTPLTPANIGGIFCAAMLTGDDVTLLDWISSATKSEIASAEIDESLFQHRNPGIPSPMAAGLPWRNYPTAITGCKVGLVEQKDDAARVEIRYTNRDLPDADYADRLLLTRATITSGMPPQWRIDNVEFDTGQTLTERLTELFNPK